MQPLKNVLAALRREIAAALETNQDLPPGTRLEAERVVLSLELSLKEKPSKNGTVELLFEVPDASSHEPGRKHTLTIEFALPPASTSSPAEKPVVSRKRAAVAGAPARLEGAEAERVTAALAKVFGAPGFDSSARASVFREALAELSDEQIRAVLDSLPGPAQPGLDETVKRARHLISGVLKSGPLRSTERGGEALAEVLAQHPVKLVIQLIADKWETQTDWLNKPGS